MKKRLLNKIRLTPRESLRLAEMVLNCPPRNERFKAAQVRYDEMKHRHGTQHIALVRGNVFLDFGFSQDEAARLKAETDAISQGHIFG